MKEKRKWIRAVCVTLSVALVCGASAIAYAAGARSAAPAAQSTPVQDAQDSQGAQPTQTGEMGKEETVYVIAGADGTPKKIIVSDWIRNGPGAERIEDASELGDIDEVKGDASYSPGGDNLRVWDANGEDIYYQGQIDKQLPVDLTVRYQLDGQPISAEELAGKSGRVTIRFDYANKQYEQVEIDGEQQRIYVPFAMLTGMMLDGDQFRNVAVTNGRVINDGDRVLVIGMAMPGLQENLDLDPEQLELPSYVEITADVTDFSLTTTLTLATNEVFDELNLDDITSFDELVDSMDDLKDAMAKLMEGSSALYEGLDTLLDKSGDLASGVRQLASGAANLAEKSGQLSDGAQLVREGADTLKTGLAALAANNDALTGGAAQVFQNLLAVADEQLAAAGLSAPKLTIDNYGEVLGGLAGSLDADAVRKVAYNTAYSTVSSAVHSQEGAIRSAVEAEVRKQVREGVITAATGMGVSEYEAAVAAGAIPQETQEQIDAAIQAKMSESQGAIQSAVDGKIQSLIEEKMNSAEVQSQIDSAVQAAQSGASSISALKDQLDSYNDFYQGLKDYTQGVADADAGATQLQQGARQVADGAAGIADGADTLSGKLGELNGGTGALTEGVSALREGSLALSDGLEQFNREGVEKLAEAVNGDLGGLITRLRATADVSKHYQTFAGKSEAMDGSVKFLYKTEQIGD
ncbi:MAG: hypothetical protein ACOYJA_00155 [Christensenellales bacterium]|jgi:putative membrane protein